MIGRRRVSWAAVLPLVLLPVAAPQPLLACAACYGQSNSAMAQGMNWGICSLLVIIVTVLGGVASFFVFLAKRSAALPDVLDLDPRPQRPPSDTAQPFN